MENKKEQTIYIVLPAYNEELNIGSLLGRIEKTMRMVSLDFQVVLVDDGSSDSTGETVDSYASSMPIAVFKHPNNMGLGATIRDGLTEAAALSADEDIIITMDADESHPPEVIPDIIKMLTRGYDVLIASRYQPGSRIIGVSCFRRALSYAASVLFRVLFQTGGVKDFTCGYRAYRSKVIKDAFLRYKDNFINEKGFQCMADILLKLRKMNLRFGEIPFTLRYDLKKGISKMHLFATIKNTILLVLRHKFSS